MKLTFTVLAYLAVSLTASANDMIVLRTFRSMVTARMGELPPYLPAYLCYFAAGIPSSSADSEQ